MNAELTVLDAANSEQRDYWITTWSSWPDREVQAHPGYLELFAAAGERVRAAIMRRV